MGYSKVIFIGGAPMVGKTTIARILGYRLKYGCISTDDISAAIASVTKRDTHPTLHYMDDYDYREYYIQKSEKQLMQDADSLHEAIWPSLLALIQNHSTWDTPAILEGWHLRPEHMNKQKKDISGVFLLADEGLFEQRTCENDFSKGASDQMAMIQKYYCRSLWYNNFLKEQVKGYGLKSLTISLDMKPEAVADKCMEILKDY